MPAIRGAKSKKKTRRYTRSIDQIYQDLRDQRHLEQFTETKATEDLPASGEWYCVECAKWFDGETNFQGHKKGKNHKRRVKQLQQEPHTHKAAEQAVGLWTDNGTRNKNRDTVMELDSEGAIGDAT